MAKAKAKGSGKGEDKAKAKVLTGKPKPKKTTMKAKGKGKVVPKKTSNIKVTVDPKARRGRPKKTDNTEVAVKATVMKGRPKKTVTATTTLADLDNVTLERLDEGQGQQPNPIIGAGAEPQTPFLGMVSPSLGAMVNEDPQPGSSTSIVPRTPTARTSKSFMIKKVINDDRSACDQDGSRIRGECAEIMIGTNATSGKRGATATATSSSASYSSKYPWLEPVASVNDGFASEIGSKMYNFNPRVLWKSATAAMNAEKAGLPSNKADQAIGYATCDNGIPVPGEFCKTCNAQICKYDVDTAIPEPQQINKVKFAKWCSNMLCTSPVNLLDVTVEEVYNNMPNIDLNRPLSEIQNDPNLGEMSLEEALSTDWNKKHEEAVQLLNLAMFMQKEYDDAIEVLRRFSAADEERKRRQAAATAPGSKKED